MSGMTLGAMLLALLVSGVGILFMANGGKPPVAKNPIPSDVLKKADEELYRTQKKFRDKVMERYYFESWTTYDHPVTPVGPLSYPETQKQVSGDVYEEVILDNSGAQTLFVFMEQFKLHKVPYILPNSKFARAPGDHYFSVLRSGEKIQVDKEVGIAGTVDLPEYLHLVVDMTEQVSLSEIVKKEPNGSTEYVYDERNLLKKVIMLNYDGSKSVLDYVYNPKGGLRINSTATDAKGNVIRKDE